MIEKIALEDLRVGMYVCGMEKVSGRPVFFMNNILLKTQADLEKMLMKGYTCLYINVDEPAIPRRSSPQSLEPEVKAAPGEACDVAEPEPELLIEEGGPAFMEACEEPGPRDARPPSETGFDEELKEARRVRGEAELLVREFLSNARLGKGPDAGKITGTVGRMVDSVFRNQDALTSLARLKSFDDYTFGHCVNVCILSIAVGRQMGLEKASIEELGTGAILHDIGKMLVPDRILNKPGKLDDEEFAIMKSHAALGGEMLIGAKISEAAMLVATEHHERYDGCGYYKGLSGDAIHLYARIAAVADVYDAMTSKRVYQNMTVPEEALKRLYLMRGTHFEPRIVEQLIKCLGIYPIGTFVELNTGELAIVKMVNRSHPMQPIIQLLSGRDKRPIESGQDVDLKDEIGRWIVATRRPEEFPPALQSMAC